MKDRIETLKFFTIAECEANPTKYYIFGDNLIHQGTGGQAIIRYCENARGVPTKRLPSMSGDAFFSDREQEIGKVSMYLVKLLMLYNSDEKPTLVFPKDGLGTGRAQLKERSPQIYKLIDEFLKFNFELEIQP